MSMFTAKLTSGFNQVKAQGVEKFGTVVDSLKNTVETYQNDPKLAGYYEKVVDSSSNFVKASLQDVSDTLEELADDKNVHPLKLQALSAEVERLQRKVKDMTQRVHNAIPKDYSQPSLRGVDEKQVHRKDKTQGRGLVGLITNLWE